MKKDYSLKGVDVVMKKLQLELKKIEGQTMAGLISAAIIIRRDMEKTDPKIPLDTGNLRSSWFTDTFITKGKPSIIFGFSANYAVYVHENLEPDIDWKRPGSGPKFLEYALKRNAPLIIKTIKNNIQL